jgi:hypothetical protein
MMEETLDMRVAIPPTDERFFKELAAKMGWRFEAKKHALRKNIAPRPQNLDLPDGEIMVEAREAGSGKTILKKLRPGSLADFFMNSPLRGSGIVLEHERDMGRDIDL